MPLNNKISSVSELVPDPTCEKDVKPHHHANDDPENILLPKMCIKPGTEIRFTKFPEYK